MKSSFFLFLISCFTTLTSISQESMTFKGTVIDQRSKQAIPFASVVARSNSTETIVAGVTTDASGTFELVCDSSDVWIQVRFIGFLNDTIREWETSNGRVDLGTIGLMVESQELESVTITAERSTMEFKLDKRVFHVGTDISSTGQGALEVLNNVPSVNVDIEGNLTLRGNSGVQILIDGKPSVMSDDPSKALGSLTADMIESIEVITNPSAKYEAGGTSGIINIILKKDNKKGLNGSVSVNTGIPHNHSVGGTVNYRTQKFNFFTQFGGGYRSLPRYNNSENRNRADNSKILSNGINYRNEQFYNITLGADYYINKYNTLTLSGNFAYEIESQPSETNFELYDSTEILITDYIRREVTTAENPKYQFDLNYKKEFKNNKDHSIQFSSLGRFFGKDQRSEFTNNYTLGSGANQRTTTNFFENNYTFKLDYTNPISASIGLELGAMYDLNDVGNDYSVSDESMGEWVLNSNLSNNFLYSQKVLGSYATGSYEKNKWGVKLGVRVENTDLRTTLENTNETNQRNFTNFFPTVHSSFKFSKKYQLQAGYSRRIFRPRLWDLNPFFNIQNSYVIRTGNPNLLPEFADSYELTGIMYFKKISLNASIYHLYTSDVVENVSYFIDNVNYMTKSNVGTNQKTGVEINGKYTPAKWFTIMGDFNYGYFVRKGVFEARVFDFSGNQWSTDFSFKFKLPYSIDFEISPNYQSKVKTVQGNVSGFFYMDAGIRKKVLKDRAVINLSVRDIFASRVRETIVDQETFYLYNYSKRGRFITLGFSYSFGKGEVMSYSGGGHH